LIRFVQDAKMPVQQAFAKAALNEPEKKKDEMD
jgi:hypothetical protein